jgi:hypothetical protein
VNQPVEGPTAAPTVLDVNKTALPVVVDLPDPDLAAEVTAHVESRLGWQVVDPGPHLPAGVRLAADVRSGTPTIVIGWAPDPSSARAALRAGALDVLAWPADASRLADIDIPARTHRPAEHLLAVAAAARGVGASTVALALGAQAAWSGRRTVVVTDAAGCDLAGVTATGLSEVAGVDGLSVAPDVHAAAAAGRPDVLVADVGCARGHVLVARPDRALARALGGDDPRAVVTVGEGGMRPSEVHRVVDGRRVVSLDQSFRVARAGLRGRVPVSLPGGYLAALAPLLDLLQPIGTGGGRG